MFRSLGLVCCVVVMAAFVFGCGGGGGGTAQMPDATEPDPPAVVDPGPTDAEQIAEARQAITTILSNARTRAQAASSVSSSIRTNADATAAQITNATNNNTAARAALALIENANSAAIAATTPAAAQTALANARNGSKHSEHSRIGDNVHPKRLANGRERSQATGNGRARPDGRVLAHQTRERQQASSLIAILDASEGVNLTSGQP